MKTASIIRIAAMLLFVIGVTVARGSNFKVSKVSWTGDALHIEIETDVPDGTELNAGISGEKTGNTLITDAIFSTVSNGRLVLDGFETDRDEKPIRPGRYWLSIAKNVWPPIATPPITIPKRSKEAAIAASKARQATAEDEEPSPDPVSAVKQSWVDDVFRVEGKINVPDATWLNVAIQDNDGTLVADEGSIYTQVRGGRFIAEGFTKDGVKPLPPGHYKVSIETIAAQAIQTQISVSAEKPITVRQRPRPTKSRLLEVRAINVANVANAHDNLPAAIKATEVSAFQHAESDMQVRHQVIKNTIDQLTSSGAVRLDCNKGKAWIDSGLWQASDAEDKENLARAIYENCSSQSIDIYDKQSAKKLARYGSVLGFRAY